MPPVLIYPMSLCIFLVGIERNGNHCARERQRETERENSNHLLVLYIIFLCPLRRRCSCISNDFRCVRLRRVSIGSNYNKLFPTCCQLDKCRWVLVSNGKKEREKFIGFFVCLKTRAWREKLILSWSTCEEEEESTHWSKIISGCLPAKYPCLAEINSFFLLLRCSKSYPLSLILFRRYRIARYSSQFGYLFFVSFKVNHFSHLIRSDTNINKGQRKRDDDRRKKVKRCCTERKLIRCLHCKKKKEREADGSKRESAQW